MFTEIELTATGCAKCGVIFALPSAFVISLRQTGESFYCPNGHPLTYGEGETKPLPQVILVPSMLCIFSIHEWSDSSINTFSVASFSFILTTP